jgi:hypothetical protein
MHELVSILCNVFALGSSDLRVGEYAAQLFLDGYGNYLATSGGFGRITKDRFRNRSH